MIGVGVEITDIELPPGPPGKTLKWLTGNVNPISTDGDVGDMYLNTITGDVFEKTGETTWTSRGNIRDGKDGTEFIFRRMNGTPDTPESLQEDDYTTRMDRRSCSRYK